MSQTIEVSDFLYDRLKQESSRRGFASIEELLARSYPDSGELVRREQQVARIGDLREKVFQRTGKMADSVDLIRQDRDR